MSLYRYTVLVAGGKEMSSKMTAKTEDEVRQRVAILHRVVEWKSLEIAPAPKRVTQSQPAKPKALSKLQRILYLQSGRCFFCGQPLSEKDASIEHLNPKSKGGASTEDNEVVCHSTLNATFGSMELKRKFEFVLKSAGSFKCPIS
jgi:5-methylcytosine-specific restriction endonuclease McrA